MTDGWLAMRDRVLIIQEDGNAFNNPTVKCIMDLLLDNGHSIDLRYPHSHAPMPAYRGIRFLPFGKVLRHVKTILYNYICSRASVRFVVKLENLFVYRHYDLVIGIDRRSLPVYIVRDFF